MNSDDYTRFEQTVVAARESGDFMPVYEAFINTDFFVGVHRQSGESPTRDFVFDILAAPADGSPNVLVSQAIERLQGGNADEAIEIRGAQLIQELNPEVGILISLESGGALGLPKEVVQDLRERIHPAE